MEPNREKEEEEKSEHSSDNLNNMYEKEKIEEKLNSSNDLIKMMNE